MLEDDDRVVELARMLSGRPGSATARRHAEELLAPQGQTRTQGDLAAAGGPDGPETFHR